MLKQFEGWGTNCLRIDVGGNSKDTYAMWIASTIVFFLLFTFLWLQRRVTVRFVREIFNSLEDGHGLIIEDTKFLPAKLPLSKYQKILEKNKIKIQALKKQHEQRTNEFNETLGGMLDGALLLDPGHIITFSNQSANYYFSGGETLIGRRLEAFIDSSQLLEMIDKIKTGKKHEKSEFQFFDVSNTYYFEATGALILNSVTNKSDKILLLFRDLTEIKKSETMRKDFVANASHELRTPITMIKGFSETLFEEAGMLSKVGRSFMQKIHKNTLRLQVLVEDLLSLSELESDGSPLNKTSNKLSEIIHGVHHYLQDKPYIDSGKLFFELEEEHDPFPFDAVKMAIAISNLIDNAFKYGNNFSKITVKTEIFNEGEWVSCSVIDDGCGIPAKDLERIFERFYVVDKGRSREKGGTGLGLSIVKHITDAHGGNIHAESIPNEKTSFTIRIPKIQTKP